MIPVHTLSSRKFLQGNELLKEEGMNWQRSREIQSRTGCADLCESIVLAVTGIRISYVFPSASPAPPPRYCQKQVLEETCSGTIILSGALLTSMWHLLFLAHNTSFPETEISSVLHGLFLTDMSVLPLLELPSLTLYEFSDRTDNNSVTVSTALLSIRGQCSSVSADFKTYNLSNTLQSLLSLF